MTIKGKVAIITGASSGIGYATALALSKVGVKVAIGARRIDKLKQLEYTTVPNSQPHFFQKIDIICCYKHLVSFQSNYGNN